MVVRLVRVVARREFRAIFVRDLRLDRARARLVGNHAERTGAAATDPPWVPDWPDLFWRHLLVDQQRHGNRRIFSHSLPGALSGRLVFVHDPAGGMAPKRDRSRRVVPGVLGGGAVGDARMVAKLVPHGL